MAKPHVTMGVVLIVIAIFMAIMGYISQFLWISILAAVVVFYVGIQLCRGKIK